MAISAVAALATTSVTALTTGFGAGILSTFAGTFLVDFALGAALGALSKPRGSAIAGGYEVNTRGSALDHQIIYGETKTGGAIVFEDSTGSNNTFFHRVIAIAGHEVDSFTSFYLNDELLTVDGSGNVTSPASYAGKVRIKTHNGSPSQLADSDLVSESTKWTSNHRLRGIAYVYLRLQFDANAFPNGVPTLTAIVRGKKVYDPRTNTTVWSDNPVLCIRDYLTSSYGLNESSTNIDDTLTSTYATICDSTSTIAGTKRYTCNGSFLTSNTPYDTLGQLLSSMGGMLWYAQGKWRVKPATWVAPTVDFNEDDLRSTISISTRHSRRDNFNTVKGTFRGSETNWQVTDYPEVTNNSFITTDNGQVSVADIDLPFTDNSIEARRIARVSLERNRQQLTITTSLGLRGLEIQVGDNIRISNKRFGWVDKPFEVLAWSLDPVGELELQVGVTLRETSPSVYDEVDDGIVYERDNTVLLSPFEVPAISISVTAEAKVSNQKVSNIGVATITSDADSRVDYVEVDYKLSSDTEYSTFGQGAIGRFSVRDLEVGFYDFRVRAINTFGVKGPYEFLLNNEINAFIGDPTDVTNFQRELSGGTVFFSWNPLPDPDLSHYEIRHNTNTTGATWSNSSIVVEKIARPATSISLPARSGTFLIRAYDKEGNFSQNFTSSVVQVSDLPQLGFESVVTENPSFTGSKSNTVISGNTLEISNTTASNPTGEYFFANVIDVSSSRQVRVTGSRVFTRKFDGGTPLWDNIPKNWDQWPDNWDTWTDEDAEFGDVSVSVFVSITDDDPTGSPTWGPYLPANGSFFQGRGFRFKAVLNSTSKGFTPNITELSAKAEY